MTRAPPPPALDRARARALLVALTLLCAPARADDPVGAPPPPSTTSPATTAPGEAELVTPAQRYRRGKSLFEYRDCPGAIGVLAELAIPGQLDDEREQLDVHRMLGICFALADQRREAAREFSSLLSIDPDFSLDPFEVPPPVVEAFDAQKQAMKARLDEIRKARERAKDELGDEGGVLVERATTIRTTPLATVLLPFGAAQAVNGDIVKGAILGVIQGVALVVNVVGYWGSIGVQAGKNDGFTPDEALAENVFWYSHLIAGGVLLVGYGVGVADALWNREEQAVLAEKQTKRPLTSSELKKLRRIERAPEPAPPDADRPDAEDGAPPRAP